MKISTQLYSGAGNTFHIVFGCANNFASAPAPREAMRKVAKEICKTDAADGFIFLDAAANVTSPELADEFKWNFFNNDGSDADMCGNATRCIGLFLTNSLRSRLKKWTLQTVRGALTISLISEGVFRVKMPSVKKHQSSLGFYCDTGVPHLVIENNNSSLFDQLTSLLKDESSKLRFDVSFGVGGTNVTYVELLSDPAKVRAASFERGVEDFTQACGTGAVAAAYFNLATRGISETQVEMPGGTLTINLQNLAAPEMTGPAVLLENHEYEIKV